MGQRYEKDIFFVDVVWIGEAGATKTDWIELSTGRLLRTEGLNAEIEGWEQAAQKLQIAACHFQREGLTINQLHYYGPALHQPKSREFMRRLLSEAFGISVDAISVYHDLIGAARAAWGTQKGIVGILGTGSNCALWDGTHIQKQAGGHGYLLGDEGGGADLGRNFLSALLHGEVPAEVEAAFWQENPYPEAQTPLELRSLTYRTQRPSAFLGGFAPFLSRWQQHPWVEALVRERIRRFIQRTWYSWRQEAAIRYVGGVAQAFQKLVQEETERIGGIWAGVVPNVGVALLTYHRQYG
ncbi:MAG: hypothetical protein RMK19_00990 [Bacteroidia bacterium]|nr:hypothetical protein [Bacteroidia bacterium]MDW8014569.1 hypothetical protein [Bacteroidia bacterium]